MAIVFPILIIISLMIAKIAGLELEISKESIGYFLIGEMAFISMGKVLELAKILVPIANDG